MAEKLLDRTRRLLRARYYSYRTEQAYLHWARRFVLYHGKRHPRELGKEAIEAFLSHLATEQGVAPSTQNQAVNALLFLYRHVLELELPWLDSIVRARRQPRVPVVLTREQVRAVLTGMSQPHDLVASLLYGSGLRISEALRLRVKDVDLERRELIVRDGKGAKDRVTVLADSCAQPLRTQVEKARSIGELDRRSGRGGVTLPYALARKYPNARFEDAWQFVFFARRLSTLGHKYTHGLRELCGRWPRPRRAGVAGPHVKRRQHRPAAAQTRPEGRPPAAPGRRCASSPYTRILPPRRALPRRRRRPQNVCVFMPEGTK